jgi:hypothetical protein
MVIITVTPTWTNVIESGVHTSRKFLFSCYRKNDTHIQGLESSDHIRKNRDIPKETPNELHCTTFPVGCRVVQKNYECIDDNIALSHQDSLKLLAINV